jgi:hypothetical protein
MKYLYPAKRIGALLIALLFTSFVTFSQNNNGNRSSVELVSFSAQPANDSRIFVSIVTGKEINASHFMIQRSNDGVNFNDIALLFSEEGDSKQPRVYSFYDHVSEADSNLMYYRLQITDRERNSTYADVITVYRGAAQLNILASANPSQKKLRVTIPGNWLNQRISYNIYNENKGISKKIITSGGLQTETIDIADLPAGVYIIQATNGNQTAAQRFAKLN